MIRKLSMLLLGALAFALLLPGIASADGEQPPLLDHYYPGIESDISYWAECTYTNKWGPEYGLKDTSRFCINGVLEYIGGAFTADPDKMNPANAKSKKAIDYAFAYPSDPYDDKVFSYADADVGFKFIAMGEGYYRSAHRTERISSARTALRPPFLLK